MRVIAAERPSIAQIVDQAIEIWNSYAIAAEADAGFDGGEFSGPANEDAEERALRQLAEKNGYSFEDLQTAMMERMNSGEEGAAEHG